MVVEGQPEVRTSADKYLQLSHNIKENYFFFFQKILFQSSLLSHDKHWLGHSSWITHNPLLRQFLLLTVIQRLSPFSVSNYS